ncbi:selenide, water dikinase SelD [soil metagenome]
MTIADEIRLTSLASCAGCAAKMPPGVLANITRPLAAFQHPDLIIGLQTSDDAAVFRIAPDRALVQTIDFFPPVVDDPYDYGRIAATNSMSDVFAMGGEVALALNVAAWPADVDPRHLERVFAGGAAMVTEAGGVIAGGHTVIDNEPKYGLSVTGFVDPAKVLTKGGALVGDSLFITKPIGVGVITTAQKNGAVDSESMAAAIASMTTLNRAASKVAIAAHAHACTDVTGFGLMGHAHEMAERSGTRLVINASSVPLLPGARAFAEAGHLPGGYHRNRSHYSVTTPGATVSDDLDTLLAALLYNPETSGGLLMAISPAEIGRFESACAEHGVVAWNIGHVEQGSGVFAQP